VKDDMDVIGWLMRWYQSNCNGDWEHLYGVKIGNIDNPGWLIDIDLTDTEMYGSEFQTVEIDNDDKDWIHCFVKNDIFHGRGDETKLVAILSIFRDWVEAVHHKQHSSQIYKLDI
jgi:hypothetical protein